MKVYLIGALANRSIITLGNEIRELGFDVFDDWISPGEETDTKWQEYELTRGRTYKEALAGQFAEWAFGLDLKNLHECDIAILVLPCGKSAHLELGWALGQGKVGYILFEEEPKRYDLMYRFADDIFFSRDELLKHLSEDI